MKAINLRKSDMGFGRITPRFVHHQRPAMIEASTLAGTPGHDRSVNAGRYTRP